MHNNKALFYLQRLLICVALLCSIGLIFIYSSSSVYALEQAGKGNFYLKKQVLGLILSLIGMIIIALIPLKYIRNFSLLAFLGSLSITTLTILPYFRRVIHGSGRWLFLGSISLQPSEFLKYALLVYLASFLAKKTQKLEYFFQGYFPCLILLGITSLVLLKQPDFGLTVTICLSMSMLFFIGQIPMHFLITTFISCLPAVLYLIIKTPYRLERIMSFLRPWDDPQGKGFQIIQSLIAIGSGGLLGRGIGSSKQKFFYLPMQHTDFIFSIIAEETGFIGACFLIFLYIFFLHTGFKLAWSLTDLFAIYTTLGFTIIVSVQALTNLLVTTGLVPTKGVGLPFVSYGNSALIAHFLMLGLIINFVRNKEHY